MQSIGNVMVTNFPNGLQISGGGAGTVVRDNTVAVFTDYITNAGHTLIVGSSFGALNLANTGQPNAVIPWDENTTQCRRHHDRRPRIRRWLGLGTCVDGVTASNGFHGNAAARHREQHFGSASTIVGPLMTIAGNTSSPSVLGKSEQLLAGDHGSWDCGHRTRNWHGRQRHLYRQSISDCLSDEPLEITRRLSGPTR